MVVLGHGNDDLVDFLDSQPPDCHFSNTQLEEFNDLQCREVGLSQISEITYSQGYEGILCGSCEDGYGQSNSDCHRCLAKSLVVLVLLAGLLWGLLIIVVSLAGILSEAMAAQSTPANELSNSDTSTRPPSPAQTADLQLGTSNSVDAVLNIHDPALTEESHVELTKDRDAVDEISSHVPKEAVVWTFDDELPQAAATGATGDVMTVSAQAADQAMEASEASTEDKTESVSAEAAQQITESDVALAKRRILEVIKVTPIPLSRSLLPTGLYQLRASDCFGTDHRQSTTESRSNHATTSS